MGMPGGSSVDGYVRGFLAIFTAYARRRHDARPPSRFYDAPQLFTRDSSSPPFSPAPPAMGGCSASHPLVPDQYLAPPHHRSSLAAEILAILGS